MIELEIEIENLSNTPLKISLPLVVGVLDFMRDPVNARFQDVAIALKEKTLHLNGRKDMSFNDLQFLALRDRYFCLIVESAAHNHTAYIKRINPKETEVGLRSPEILLLPGQKDTHKFHIYLGPQDLQFIKHIQPQWNAVIYYGTFNLISHLLLQLLQLLYNLVHNWGGAIIILSGLIYFLLFPLTLKQLRSAKEMQALQPRIEELKKAYKDNPQKQNKEMMELFREHKINPLAGCLPLILQLPIFLALYQALMRSVVLKGAPFLWIKDLSSPDRLFVFSLAAKRIEVNILPILMTIAMFIQQKSSMATSAGSSAEQQKIMLIIFPLMFGFIFYQMPSGLVLYWFINSSLMLTYQLRINKLK